MIGSTISTYKVTAKLGEGGMGQVYRAHDTALGRDVALKLLPPGFSDNPERLARFEREARLLASLNHANIAAIYGIVPHENERVLVLELVEGADLSEHLQMGPMPVDEAVKVARQVADALESAHDNGVIHRDLKPANIQTTPDGTVKVLDFGLAKALDPAGDRSDPDLSKSPTMIASGTVEGVILGTAAYMSPEQARGKALDRRADVWAFGCVLYELLTGRQAFSGETVSDTLASILKTEPDFDLLPDNTPLPVRRLLERCLEKDARQRLRDIGEARIILEKVERGEVVGEAPSAETAPAGRAGSSRTGWIAALVFFVAAAALAAMLATRTTPEPELLALSVTSPADGPFALQGYHPGPPMLSADGKRVVFCTRAADGTFIYVRDLDNPNPYRINGTQGAGYPFWSPDGRHIGFFANGMLMRVGADGSPPMPVCDARFGKGGTWSADGTIVFAPTFNAGLHRVSENGGTSEEITTVDPSKGENSHRFPVFLPDGRRYLFLARGGSAGAASFTTQGSRIVMGSLDSDGLTDIMTSTAQVALSAGHVLFLRGNVLMAQPIDAQAGALSGEAFPLIENVRGLPGAARAVFDASDNGRLVYMTGSALPGYRLLLVDETGREVEQVGEEGEYAGPRVSPDGKHIALEVYETVGGVNDIWVYEVARGVRTRLTFSAGPESNPVWSPDGRYVAYSGTDSTGAQIYRKAMDGSAPAELVFGDDNDKFISDWSADGRHLIYTQSGPDGATDIWMVEAEGESEGKQPVALLTGPFAEFDGRVSPDGRWMAYSSTETGGRVEVFVTTFPKPGSRYRLSHESGNLPNWSPDGRALFYYSVDGRCMRVDLMLSDSGGLTAATPVAVFDAAGIGAFDVLPDGSGFVTIQPFDPLGAPPLNFLTDWRAAFARGRGR